MTKYEEILDQAHNNNVPVYENWNFDTYNSLTPNWYYKVLR